MSFFESKLPSDGTRKVFFRAYTIDDAIAVSGMDSGLREAFASRFLKLIQTGENPVDPSREMTIQDRQALLLRYAADSLQPESMTRQDAYTIHKCPLCGEKHTFKLSFVDIGSDLELTILEEGDNSRQTEFAGQKLFVTPLRGEHAEKLEALDNTLEELEARYGPKSEQYQTKRVEKRLYRLLAQISLPEEAVKDKDPKALAEATEKWLRGLSADDFVKLEDLAADKQAEMKHGVELVHKHPCPKYQGDDAKEGLVACSLPFRLEEFIPRI